MLSTGSDNLANTFETPNRRLDEASCGGRVLAVSQASCTFHLRQLAKYGFAEDAAQIEGLVVQRAMQAILDHSRRPDSADPEWQHKAGIVSATPLPEPELTESEDAPDDRDDRQPHRFS